MGSDPEEEGQGRTACTPGPGCSEAGQSCEADEIYGLYAGAIREYRRVGRRSGGGPAGGGPANQRGRENQGAQGQESPKRPHPCRRRRSEGEVPAGFALHHRAQR